MGLFGGSSCDLLSFSYLWNIGNNEDLYAELKKDVVICSHFSIFGTLETTDYQQQSNIHIVT